MLRRVPLPTSPQDISRLQRIGELARAAGVATSTVRYWERLGLIQPAGRTAANYRVYDSAALERLRFIRAAQATGFTLADVQVLLRPAPCGEVQECLDARLLDVEARLGDLRRVRRVLRAALQECREHERSGRCHVIDRLASQSRRAP